MAFLGTVLSWFLITYFGRRTLYLAGEITLMLVLLIIGIISVSSDSDAALWAQGGFTIFWLFVYSLTVGPIAYAIVSETSSVRLRAQTVVLARNTYQIVNIISGVLIPYMLNPTEWNWTGKTGFFWAGTAGLTATWAYFRLPEAKVRSIW
jgi:SP family general alpha glucoside:H+ symporter-like MFS transporter